MSENNYGNNQGNAQNPYAAQQPNSSAQSSYGQNYGQAPATQNTYGQDYGQSASAQNSYGQTQQNTTAQNAPQQHPQQDAYGYGQPAGYPYAAPVTKKAPGMALAAMILGIAAVLTGFLVFGALLGIAAIILGVLSLKKTKEVGAGKAFALTGIITGAVSVLISICMLFVAISLVQATQKCLEVGTEDGYGNVVCQIGDNPNNRMTVSAHR